LDELNVITHSSLVTRSEERERHIVENLEYLAEDLHKLSKQIEGFSLAIFESIEKLFPNHEYVIVQQPQRAHRLA
jgi:hypothetical protein